MVVGEAVVAAGAAVVHGCLCSRSYWISITRRGSPSRLAFAIDGLKIWRGRSPTDVSSQRTPLYTVLLFRQAQERLTLNG